jgi:hypothetical protein
VIYAITLCREGRSRWTSLVALPAENQGFAPTRCHPSDPEGFLPPPWLTQVREFTDVVNFAVRRGAAQFASLSQKALDHLTAIAVYLLRLIVEDSLLSLLLPRSWMTPKTVSAVRISRTSPRWSSDHLSPFALCPALPGSLGGRDSADYYGDSVALGLAPRRRSRVPSMLDVSSTT